MAQLAANGLPRGRNRRRSHSLLVYFKMSFIVALALISPMGIHGKVFNSLMCRDNPWCRVASTLNKAERCTLYNYEVWCFVMGRRYAQPSRSYLLSFLIPSDSPIVTVWKAYFKFGLRHELRGPFIAYTERFSLCDTDNQPLPWRWHLRGTHFNPAKPRDPQLLTGNITGEKFPLDKNSWAKVVIDVRSNNQWKENGFIFAFKDNACQNFKDHIPTVYELFFQKNETKGDCKIEPGVYEVENGPIRWVFPKFPIAFYGHFRFKLMFGMAEVQHACMSVDCKTIPKGVGIE